uniref:Activin_recp domain-containing protein n=1 Tax=Panagrellus redivivus TaxID=6233 RepID=A0A7E4UNJ0_PANRE
MTATFRFVILFAVLSTVASIKCFLCGQVADDVCLKYECKSGEVCFKSNHFEQTSRMCANPNEFPLGTSGCNVLRRNLQWYCLCDTELCNDFNFKPTAANTKKIVITDKDGVRQFKAAETSVATTVPTTPALETTTKKSGAVCATGATAIIAAIIMAI